MINQTKQLGFHYYSDTDHYDEASLDYWLPKLLAVGTRWLVLSIIERAEIPENFLKRVTAAGIEPIICPQFSISNPPGWTFSGECLIIEKMASISSNTVSKHEERLEWMNGRNETGGTIY